MTISLKKQTGMKCPKCGSTQFENYVDSYSGFCLDYSVGRCYSPKCGYDLSPEAYIKEITEEKKEFTIVDFLFNPKPNNFNTINPVYLMDTIGLDSNFLVYLRSEFSADEVLKAVYDYMISATDDKKTIFWRIDRFGRILMGKSMSYKSIFSEEKTDECEFIYNTPSMDWLNDYGLKQEDLDKDYNKDLEMGQCLFGEHLIRQYPNKPIAIMESEFDAIILSLSVPNFNFMAIGEFENFNSKNINPFKDNLIVALPNSGNMKLWMDRANNINRDIGSNIEVLGRFEELAKRMRLKPNTSYSDLFQLIGDPAICNKITVIRDEIISEMN